MKKVIVIAGNNTIEFLCERVDLIQQHANNVVLLLTRATIKGIDAGNLFVPYEKVLLWNC